MPRISRRAALALPGFAAASAALAAPASDDALIALTRHWMEAAQAEHAILSQYYNTLDDTLTPQEAQAVDALHWRKSALETRIGMIQATTVEGYRAKAALLLHKLGIRPGNEAEPTDDDFLAWSLCRDLSADKSGTLAWWLPPD